MMIHNDEGVPFSVKKDQMVFLPKGLYAITDIIPDGESFEAYVLFFDESIIKNLKIDSSAHDTLPTPLVFRQNVQLVQYLKTFRQLYTEMNLPQEMCKFKITETLNYILQLEDGQRFKKALAQTTSKPKKELTSFMELHYDKPLSVEQFAELSGMSVATFRRKFHLQFQTSPKKWLIQKRLQKAQEILKRNELPVNQVALASGYSDIPHFIKSFEQHFHISPKKFAQTFA